tara:strand:+ start:144 stop:503 length:360 start_codon:yes stop_codon:yes gene_type:complete
MANLGNGWMNVKSIDKGRLKTLKSGAVGFNFQFAINDEVDDFGNNVSVWMSQTEDERKAKAKRIYLGNGKLTWSNGVVTIVNKDNPSGLVVGPDGVIAKETPAPAKAEVEAEVDPDLPF